MANGTGTATIDFGTGGQRAFVTVTGQTGLVTSGGHVEAFWMADTSADHSDYEHQMAAMVCALTCGNIVDNTSFDIVATSQIRMRGTFTVHWVWTAP